MQDGAAEGGEQMKRTIRIFLLLLILIPYRAAFAQVDIVGDWGHTDFQITTGAFGEDAQDRGTGPDPGNFLGLPVNEAGLSRAETWTASLITVPEHQCEPHPGPYAIWGPGTMTIDKEFDRDTRQLVAYHLDGTYGIDRTVWMDGRPHPSEDALHTYEGFSTGSWVGDALRVETTHLKESWLRRNGVQLSERARMVEYFARHDNYLTIIMMFDDPVYLSEPMIRTTEYVLNERPPARLGRFGFLGDEPVFFKCFPAEELGGDKHRVPHFLPGASPFVKEFAQSKGIPESTVRAGARAIYPEYMQELAKPAGPASVPLPRPPAADQRNAANTGVHSMHVQGDVWMIMGAGGNIAVQVGSEGVLVVDTGLEQMAESVLAEIRKIAGGKPIRFIINTHWHPDHTGGNVKLSGPPQQRQKAAIFAHEDVLLQLTERKMPASNLTMDTFFGESKEMYFNGEGIQIIHVPSAHTNTDSMVYFRKSDVLVGGDILVNTSYPVFNPDEGGSLNGSLDALNRILDITIAEFRQQGGTMVIPGHGRVYDEADVRDYRNMVAIVRDRIQNSITKGRTLEQIKAESPTLDYDALWGTNTDRFIEAAYRSLTAK